MTRSNCWIEAIRHYRQLRRAGVECYFWGLGTASSAAGVLLYKGTISPNIVCGSGGTPVLTAGTVVTED